MPASAAGLAADIVTNPANLLAMIGGKLPLGGGKTLGGVIGQTKPAQAIGRFMTKKRATPKQIFKNLLNKTSLKTEIKTVGWQKQDVGTQATKAIQDLTKQNTKESTIGLSMRLCYGFSYSLTHNIGLGGEIGLGGPLLQMAVTYKL
jgi:hypothetical protein